MKYFLIVLLAIALVATFVGCTKGNDKPDDPDIEGNDIVINPDNNDNPQDGGHGIGIDPDSLGEKLSAFIVDEEFIDGGAVVSFNRMPQLLVDLEGVDFTDEYQVAAAIIAVLDYYNTNPDLCFEMFDVLMGPESPGAFDKNFIKEQFSQYPYVARSYIEGATPENDYTSEEISYKITEKIYSRDEEGYVQLWFKSGGADSERAVKLRQKASTGEWFLFSDSYKGLLAGIRIPASQDKWN